jgi:hypothetical protein
VNHGAPFEPGSLPPEDKGIKTASPGGAVRADAGKLDWDLMPWAQLEEVVRVLMGDGPDKGGAAQYGRWNWQKGAGDSDFQLRTRNSLTRHVVAYLQGERKDPVTGLHPLAHAVCNCLFLMYYDGKGKT